MSKEKEPKSIEAKSSSIQNRQNLLEKLGTKGSRTTLVGAAKFMM
jgi:DNA repair photolyase